MSCVDDTNTLEARQRVGNIHENPLLRDRSPYLKETVPTARKSIPQHTKNVTRRGGRKKWRHVVHNEIEISVDQRSRTWPPSRSLDVFCARASVDNFLESPIPTTPNEIPPQRRIDNSIPAESDVYISPAIRSRKQPRSRKPRHTFSKSAIEQKKAGMHVEAKKARLTRDRATLLERGYRGS